MAVRVYLANDHDIVREGIKGLLSRNSIFHIVGEYTGYGDMINIIERWRPNLLFVDVDSTSFISLKTITRIKELYPKILIVAIMYNADKNTVEEMINININGIFMINFKVEEFMRGLADILSKGSYVQANLFAEIEKCAAQQIPDKIKINSLTKREMEVLIQVANGMFNKEIAIALNISERTVKNHLSNIFKKIEVSDRTQAAVFAIKNGIVEIY